MNEYPRLKAALAVRVVGEDKVFVLADDRQHLMRGRDVALVVPYLDGRHTMADVVAATAGRLSFAECVRALARLQSAGHLHDGGTADDPEITVVSFTQDPEPFVTLLRGNGIRVGETGAVVVLADDYLDPRLAELDERMRVEDRSWLLVKPTGADVWAGPSFLPGVTGCWHCLRDRLDGNRPVARFLRLTTGEDVRPPVVVTRAALGLAAGLVASAVAAPAVTEGVLISISTNTLEAEHHRLARQPQCAACGDPSLVPASPKIELTERFGRAGRVMAAEATFARLEKHVSRLLGAVTSVRPLDGAEVGLAPSYAASHNFAFQAGDLDGLRRTMRGQSGGKGRTDGQAKTSAVCEAVERFCGVWQDSYAAAVTPARLADLGPDVAIAPHDLLLFSDKQYEQGNDGRLHHVPRRFDPAREISWSPAWSLTHERQCLVPSGYAYFGHPDLARHPYCAPDANGNAAGNTVEEAVLQGFCELVERDSVALWWYNRLRRPEFDLDRLADPYVAQLRDFYAGEDRELWVLDLTADLAIPAFAAVSRRLHHEQEDVLLGFGAHLDTRVAVLRALTEMNQSLPGVRGRHADGRTDYRETDPDVLAWWRDVRVADHDWLLPAGRVSTVVQRATGDLAEEVRYCVDTAAKAGLDVIVLDQTRPDIELAVVKVMVPGLRHFWRRLGPGRLYDVPVELGWLDVPTTEDGCNPVSVFF